MPEARAEHDYLLAFLVTIGAGFSTAIGALSVRFGSLRNPKLLAVGMALAAGVMLLVSLVEIFHESVASFEEAWPVEQYPHGKRTAYLLATITFFAGALLTVFLEMGVHKFQHALGGEDADHHDLPNPAAYGRAARSDEEETLAAKDKDVDADKANDDWSSRPLTTAERAGLIKTALITGLAISIHNIPEGLATFISMSAGANAGLPLAFAIAVHNIPEGLCVAIPVLYATGSRWKGFLWGTLTGLSEPLGALIGFAILESTAEQDLSATYGALFGIISGMMTYISLAELVPTALKYYPNQRNIALLVFAGMAFMAASLVLFEYAEK
ncbi:hypothetical protein H9P43_001887 [Blastocladiella emersonii ATCC 22665]|nr:hypothetical protein H9P43_001887 [Blastocladiella emersonii ATCC 22665]